MFGMNRLKIAVALMLLIGMSSLTSTGLAALENGSVYKIKCYGYTGDTIWLNGQTMEGSVGLVSNPKENSGTNWQAIEVKPGVYQFKCLGSGTGPRWLDGQPDTNTVRLVPNASSNPGTSWNVTEPESGIYQFECSPQGKGDRWLEGQPSSANVILTTTINNRPIGVRWEVSKKEGSDNNLENNGSIIISPPRINNSNTIINPPTKNNSIEVANSTTANEIFNSKNITSRNVWNKRLSTNLTINTTAPQVVDPKATKVCACSPQYQGVWVWDGEKWCQGG
jgi:hypothetical protein